MVLKFRRPTRKPKARRPAKKTRMYAKKKYVRKARTTAPRAKVIACTSAGAITKSSATITHSTKNSGLARVTGKLSNYNVIMKNFIGGLKGFSGQQAVTDYSHMNLTQLRDLQQNCAATNYSQTNRVALTGYETDLVYTNQQNAPLELEIYDVVPRRDLAVIAEWRSSDRAGIPFTVNLSPEPTFYWEGGEQVAGSTDIGGLSSNSAKYYGAKPTDSSLFNQYWKVCKKTVVELGVGCTHRHQVNRKMSFMLDSAITFNDTMDMIAGLSFSTMVVIRGFGGANHDSGGYTTVPPFITQVARTRIKFGYVIDNTNSVQQVNALPVNFSVDTRNIVGDIVNSA